MARIFIQFHSSSTVWVESTIAYSETSVVFSGFRVCDDASRAGMMTMMHVCCLDEALLGVVCVGYLMCAAQRL